MAAARAILAGAAKATMVIWASMIARDLINSQLPEGKFKSFIKPGPLENLPDWGGADARSRKQRGTLMGFAISATPT